jgi:hypothetical protein
MPIISTIVSAAAAAFTAVSGFVGSVTAAFSAGGFLAGGTVAGFVARAALSIGLSMGLNAFAGQNSRKRGATAEPAANNQTLQIGGNIPRQVAFGRVGTKGQLSHVWAHGAGSAYLTQVFVLSDGRIGGLTGLWLGDKKLTLRPLTPTHGEHQRFDTAEHDSPNFDIRIFDGRDGQAGAHSYLESVGAVGTPGQADAYAAADRGAGVAYAVVTVWQFNSRWSGIPDWTFEIDGYRCYDPRFDSTAGGSGPMRWDDRATWAASSNPAVQIYNYLRGIVAEGQVVMGMEVPAFDLQNDLFMAAASICDEPVALAAGGVEARYVASLIVTADEGEHRNALAPLVQAMAGYLVEKVGQFGVIAGAAQVPVASISDQDLVWTRGARYSGKLSRQSRANEVHGQFIDTAAAWQPNSYAPVKDAGALANDGERLAQQLDLPAVPSPTQAFRIAKARLRESRRQATADIEVGYHFLWLEIGDWITWSSERYGFTKTFRVVGWGRNADDTTALSLREVGAEIYSHTAADEVPFLPPGTGPLDAPLLSTPQGFAVQADVAPGTNRPIIICTWNAITDVRVVAVIIEYRPVGTLDSTRVRDDTPLDGRYVIDQPATGPEYEYRAQLRTEPPRPVFWTNWVRLQIDPASVSIPSLMPDVVDAFADIQAQVRQIRANINALAQHAGEIGAGTRLNVIDVTERVGGAEASISQTVETLATLDAAFAAFETVVETRFNSAESSIVTNATGLSTLNSAFGSYQTVVNTRLDSAESSISANSTGLSTLNSAFGSFQTTVNTRLNAAEADISTNATGLSTLDSAFGSFQTTVNTRLGSNSANISSVMEALARGNLVTARALTGVSTTSGSLLAAGNLEIATATNNSVAEAIIRLMVRVGAATPVEAGMIIHAIANGAFAAGDIEFKADRVRFTPTTPTGGRMVLELLNNRIDVYDASNVLRVRMGKLT